MPFSTCLEMFLLKSCKYSMCASGYASSTYLPSTVYLAKRKITSVAGLIFQREAIICILFHDIPQVCYFAKAAVKKIYFSALRFFFCIEDWKTGDQKFSVLLPKIFFLMKRDGRGVKINL